jgi:NhaA family Na+:H+ antiporter
MSDKRQIRVPKVGGRLPPYESDFVDIEVLSGIVLAAATVMALAWANVDPSGYEDLWHASLPLDLDLRHFVNDGLMALFFFVVGLEIKRELVLGELRDRRTASLPVAAALGGMLVPALIYLAVNAGGPGGRGWGIPMATDIAFALAVLALAGSRAPRALKLFLLTLAIVDDIGAILVIALFYSDHISVGWLLEAGAIAVLIVVLRRVGLTHPAWYVVPAALLWWGTYESGVHATIAGVVLGLLTPTGDVGGRPVLATLEARLHPWSSFVVVPLFALANAGIVFTADGLHQAATGAVAWGVLLGLVVGKPVGILGATALARRVGLGSLPGDLTMRSVAGAAFVAGIGFTVSLFVADLAFSGEQLEAAKVAVLAASVLAAGIGSIVVRRSSSAAR